MVCPTYNEREQVQALARALFARLPLACLLFVDDASPDGTGRELDTLAMADPRVTVLHRVGKRGLGTAYVDGFIHALSQDFAVIGQIDADLSHDPGDLPRMLSAVSDGADVVIGSRNVPGGAILGWGLGRHLLSKGGSRYARMFLGGGVDDWTSGFKLFQRSALLALDPATLRSNGYAFQIEMTHRALTAGLRVDEVPVVFLDRRVGESKMSRTIFLEAVFRVIELRLRGA